MKNRHFYILILLTQTSAVKLISRVAQTKFPKDEFPKFIT